LLLRPTFCVTCYYLRLSALAGRDTSLHQWQCLPLHLHSNVYP
jgi:hypothetical protein